jgi:hypothetical protein
MQPTTLIWKAQADLLVADTNTLGAVVALGVHLAKANFAPSLNLVIADLVQADFDGYATKAAGAAPYDAYYDAVSGFYTVRIKEPAGGWNWITTGLTNLPQTIYGAYLANGAGTDLYGSMLFAEPVVLTDIDQGVGIGDLLFQWRLDSPF